jgi:hypothetical protein
MEGSQNVLNGAEDGSENVPTTAQVPSENVRGVSGSEVLLPG